MTIYTFANIMTGFIEAIMMFILFETFCTKRDNLPNWIYGVGIIALAVLINLSNIFFASGGLNVINMTASFFAISFLYRTSVSIRGIISLFSLLILVISEILVMFVITLIYNVTVSEVVNTPTFRLLGIILSKVIAFLIINIIRLKFKQKSFRVGKLYWLLLFTMLVSSTATVFLIFKLSYNIEFTYMYNLSVFCSFGLLFSTFFALYLYEHLAKQSEIIRNQQQYEQHLRSQLKHLDEILITQNQIKKFKHDFLNYIIGLKGYLNNNDCNGAINYINDLNKKFTIGNIVETGNSALDAILSTKKALAENKGIKFIMRIQIPEKISVDSIDLCIIFGNALDNAIEACDKVKTDDRRIAVTIIYRGESIFCKIVNTALKTERTVFTTSKFDKKNHGFGLENIKTTLAKYNSEPNIEHTDTDFILKFLIFVKE